MKFVIISFIYYSFPTRTQNGIFDDDFVQIFYFFILLFILCFSSIHTTFEAFGYVCLKEQRRARWNNNKKRDFKNILEIVLRQRQQQHQQNTWLYNKKKILKANGTFLFNLYFKFFFFFIMKKKCTYMLLCVFYTFNSDKIKIHRVL